MAGITNEERQRRDRHGFPVPYDHPRQPL